MLPGRFRVHNAEPAPGNVLSPSRLVLESGTVPLLGSAPLASLVTPASNVVIAFTDTTRPSPDHILVSLLRSELEKAGVLSANITLLCATGLHRPVTDEELRAKLGPENLRDIRVINHRATDPDHLTSLGPVNGIPAIVNRLCPQADLVLATGIVEPHQYAGFSGGAKTIAIGCGGEETIRQTHGVEMLDREGTTLGSLRGNPFQEFVRRAAERAGLRYILNVVLNQEGEIIAAACGRPDEVHDHLAAQALNYGSVTISGPVHLAIAGVPEAKAANLYQASRAATYLGLGINTPLLPGAPIILPAALPEGPGDGTGEQRFFRILSEASSPSALVAQLRKEGFPAGAQRAYVLARLLCRHPVIVAGAECPDVVRACHMTATPTLETALDVAEQIVRKTFDFPENTEPDLLYVGNGLTTLVRLAEENKD